jgi:hypothetical protein
MDSTSPQLALSPLTADKLRDQRARDYLKWLACLYTADGAVHAARRMFEERYAYRARVPEVDTFLKAAVAAGTTTDATWASPLVGTTIAQAFVELSRARSVLAQIGRPVPFYASLTVTTTAAGYNWSGEAHPKAVSAMAFTAVEALRPKKITGTIVVTSELLRSLTAVGERFLATELTNGLRSAVDSTLLSAAAATAATPAGILNGVTGISATADPGADLVALLDEFFSNNPAGEVVTIIGSPSNLVAAAKTLGTASELGVRLVPSSAAGTNVIAVDGDRLLVADGGVVLTLSREATLELNTTPVDPTGASAVLTSLWQHDLAGLRAERFLNWAMASTSAVSYVDGASWTIPTA